MSYGIVIWGASDGALRTVFVAQKRLIRALAGERPAPRTAAFFFFFFNASPIVLMIFTVGSTSVVVRGRRLTPSGSSSLFEKEPTIPSPSSSCTLYKGYFLGMTLYMLNASSVQPCRYFFWKTFL
ncbi:Hypothetical predicted protein [Cloeon dipterum]|uniref:Uncharacterized protein n=1 Tax=Cloeon dipterum TaxID=197152 RepID=A0A8S1DP76_9INSE|nr:Hypothetical predicted protein [Cloeon dipterum]